MQKVMWQCVEHGKTGCSLAAGRRPRRPSPAGCRGRSERSFANRGRSGFRRGARYGKPLDGACQTRRTPGAESAASRTAAGIAIGATSSRHNGAHDPQRLPRSVELAVRPVDPRSSTTAVVAEIRCASFGMDGGALFAGLGADPTEAGATRVRTRSGGRAEMAGGRISCDSRTGATVEGANSLAGRDGAAFGPSGGTKLRTPRADAGRIWHRPAFSLQHDLFDHQSGAIVLHDFPAAFHGAGVSEFSQPTAAPDAEDQAENISDCGWPPGTQVSIGAPLAGRAR